MSTQQLGTFRDLSSTLVSPGSTGRPAAAKGAEDSQTVFVPPELYQRMLDSRASPAPPHVQTSEPPPSVTGYTAPPPESETRPDAPPPPSVTTFYERASRPADPAQADAAPSSSTLYSARSPNVGSARRQDPEVAVVAAPVVAAEAEKRMTDNGTILMHAIPYQVADPGPRSVRSQLDEMSMVLDIAQMQRRVATADPDALARYVDELRRAQGLPPADETGGARVQAPLAFQQGFGSSSSGAASTRERIDQRYEAMMRQAEQVQRERMELARHLHEQPAWAPYDAEREPPQASRRDSSQPPPAWMVAEAAARAPSHHPPASASVAPWTPMSCPLSQPPRSMVPLARPQKHSTAFLALLFAVMFVMTAVGVGALTYVAMRSHAGSSAATFRG